MAVELGVGRHRAGRLTRILESKLPTSNRT